MDLFPLTLAAGGLIAAAALVFMLRRRAWRSLTSWIMLAIGVGVMVGATFHEHAPGIFTAETEHPAQEVHGFLKDLFLNALKMIIVPLIFTSIVSGVLSLGRGRGLGRLGLKTLAYYLVSSLLAILVGLMLVNLIQPGAGASELQLSAEKLEEEELAHMEESAASTLTFLLRFLKNLLPVNPFAAFAQGNILQVIVFGILIGVFITRIDDPYRTAVSHFFEGLFRVLMGLVHLVLWLAPLGIYAIFVEVMARTGPEAFEGLGLYAGTVTLGLLFHACVSLPLLLVLVGRVNPLWHLRAMSKALVTAFSTSSSSATLPLTLESVQERAGVSRKVSSFTLPLGATVNMDGTALYECVGAIFIYQVYVAQGGPAAPPPLTVGDQVVVVVTALMASIGAAGIPMAGLVMMSIILRAIGMPLEGVAYILAVDRILDMMRTTVNVWSDSCGAVLIARSEGEDTVLRKSPGPDRSIAEPEP